MNELSDTAIVAEPSRSEKTRRQIRLDQAEQPRLCSPASLAERSRQIAGLYSEKDHFRSHIDMARHGSGKGECRYFK